MVNSYKNNIFGTRMLENSHSDILSAFLIEVKKTLRFKINQLYIHRLSRLLCNSRLRPIRCVLETYFDIEGELQ